MLRFFGLVFGEYYIAYWDSNVDVIKALAIRRKLREKYGEYPRIFFLTNPYQKFHTKQGWIEAYKMQEKTKLIDLDDNIFHVEKWDVNKTYNTIFSTENPNVGIYPSYTGENIRAVTIDLTTAEELDCFELGQHPFLDKFSSFVPEEELRETFDIADDEAVDYYSVELHGFKTQERKDTSQLTWQNDDFAKATVYNLELENAQGYFVGKYGILTK